MNSQESVDFKNATFSKTDLDTAIAEMKQKEKACLSVKSEEFAAVKGVAREIAAFVKKYNKI